MVYNSRPTLPISITNLDKSSVFQSVASEEGVFAHQDCIVQRDPVLDLLSVERAQILQAFHVQGVRCHMSRVTSSHVT